MTLDGVLICAVDVDADDVARGPDAATLLDSTDIRNKIVDELMEVELSKLWLTFNAWFC